MLYLVADLDDASWLKYVAEEFVRIQGAGFAIAVAAGAGDVPEDAPSVRYSQAPAPGAFADRSAVMPDGGLTRVSESVYILPGTEAGSGFELPYDPFWNCFVFLSRLEEVRGGERGTTTMGYASRHPRSWTASFDVPVVNHIFADIERVLRNRFPDLPWIERRHPVIEYSHDVDYITKTPQLRLKQTAMNAFNLVRGRGSLKRTLGFFLSSPSYWQFDYWRDLEEAHGVRSVFYIYAGARHKGLRSWLLDPSYRVDEGVRLRDALAGLLERGFEVGLHGSYESAVDGALLAGEKEILERAIGRSVTKTRQHWLRYDETRTPRLHEKLFEFDSTIGWNDRMGFRSGCASQYRPWLHDEKRPCAHFVTPQVLMDSNVFDYGAGRDEELGGRALEMLKSLASINNAHVSVSWHQRVSSADYGWHPLYERILETMVGQ